MRTWHITGQTLVVKERVGSEILRIVAKGLRDGRVVPTEQALVPLERDVNRKFVVRQPHLCRNRPDDLDLGVLFQQLHCRRCVALELVRPRAPVDAITTPQRERKVRG